MCTLCTISIIIIETGFKLIASRLDDHVLEARAASGKDAQKCLFNILLRVINDYSYCVDILSTALDSGHETVIRIALHAALSRYRLHGGAEIKDICQKLFTAAVRSGNSELVRMLLQLPQLRGYVDVNCVVDATTDDTALHLACRMGSTLINQSFDNDLYSKTVDLAKFLELEDDQKHNGAFFLQCWSNYYRFVASIATADKDCARRLKIWRLLAMSSEILKLQMNVRFEEYVKVTQLLIQHGADVYAWNNKGETALHVAAFLQLHGDVLLEIYALCPAYELKKDLHWQCNCCLIGTFKKFKEINLLEAQRFTLFKAIVCNLFSPWTIRLLNTVVYSYFQNMRSLIRMLLRDGMDVDVTTNFGETALLIAANEASKCIAFCREIYTLAATEVDDCQDLKGKATAFGEFLRANVFTVVRELLLHDADWHIGGSNGSDLLNVALHSNQADLLVELVRQGAQPVS